ncbi:hypothetical protein BHM03_00036965 [Ensete ventricosum]|nr:hypothetical protein BHM03_00036965 [Ensete ventricosum]
MRHVTHPCVSPNAMEMLVFVSTDTEVGDRMGSNSKCEHADHRWLPFHGFTTVPGFDRHRWFDAVPTVEPALPPITRQVGLRTPVNTGSGKRLSYPAMGVALLSDLLTEVLIPVAAVVGIVFAMVQWLLVSKVKLSPEVESSGTGNSKNGYSDYLIEEEEGLNDHNVVVKCAEIQSAISEGESNY